jgi:hypothetical protein
MTPPVSQDKWAPLIKQINETEDTGQKVNLIATMLQMVATNDLTCLEDRVGELSRKFDAYMKRIYSVGIAIAALVFTGLDIKTVVNFIVKLVR